MKEKCHAEDEKGQARYYSCRLSKGHVGNHKWWTSIGNSPSHEWKSEGVFG